MAFIVNKNLVFIDSVPFRNFSLEKLVNKLSDNDFKYLKEELGSKNSQHLKRKSAYSYKCIDNFKRFGEEKSPDKEYFQSSAKDGKTDDNGEKLEGHISDEDYFTCKKTWNEFNEKNMGGYYEEKEFLTLLKNMVKQIANT